MFARLIRRLYPYLIEGTRTGIIMAAGDTLAQTAIENKDFKNIDYMRTIRYGSLGFVFIGPLLTYWYAFLDRNIPQTQMRFRRALKKMLVDQCFVAPTLNLHITALVGMINNESCEAVRNRIRDQYPTIMKNNYMLWPAVLLINFSIIPLKYQVVFTQSVALPHLDLHNINIIDWHDFTVASPLEVNSAVDMTTRIGSRINSYIMEGARAGGIMATGDVLAQTLVEKKDVKDIDYVRTAKYGSLGFIFVGPVLKYWYGLLDRRITTNQNRFQRTLKKMLVDQSVMAPTINLSIAVLVGVINDESKDTIKERLKVQYPEIMKTNYILWPAVQMINFSIVPLKYQVVFAQVVAVVWNCFVSQLLNTVL